MHNKKNRSILKLLYKEISLNIQYKFPTLSPASSKFIFMTIEDIPMHPEEIKKEKK